MRAVTIAVSVLLSLSGQSASLLAEPLSMDYVYANQFNSEVNSQDADGGTVGIFNEFGKRWHFTLSQGDAGWGAAGAKKTTTRFGLGGQMLLGQDMLLAPTVSILSIETKTPSVDDVETVWSAQLDLRYSLSNQIELITGVRYLDQNNSTTSGLEVGLMLHFTDWIAAGGIARREGDTNSTEWTVRVYY